MATKIISRILLIVTLFPFIVDADPISEAEWSRCAAIQNNDERLVCFDDLTSRNQPVQLGEENKSSEQLNKIMRRCRSQMGSYGSAMVKACVDQDVEALRSLSEYPSQHDSIVGRCYQQMGNYGWSMVKACADQDIEAERALQSMGQ